jgi:HSP20 family protein
MTNIPPQRDPTPTEIAEPWTEFDRFFHDLSHRLDAAFGGGPDTPGSLVGRAPRSTVVRAARTDVVDTGTSFRVSAEVPGIPKEKLEVRVVGENVEIRSHDESETAENSGEFLHRERVFRGVYRAVLLPEPVVAEKATAKLVDGILELDLPKETPTPAAAEVRVPIQ